jgi:hypothetical protein
MSFIAHELTKEGPWEKVSKTVEASVVHITATDDLFEDVFGSDE